MAYISYRHEGVDHVGVVDGDSVVPLAGVRAIGQEVGTDALESAQQDRSRAVPRSEVTVLPASTAPRRIVCVGLNYRAHIEETNRGESDYPVLFTKFATSLIGAHDPIIVPPESDQVDYEAELAVIIGRPGRRIPAEHAERHILGYSTANDVTMRDYQYKTHQWVQGKSWDGSTPVGPRIVTPDEVDVSRGGIRTFVNGVKVQDSDLSLLIFSIPHLVATISTFTTLEPGDVILTGTPGGVGFRRDPQLFLTPGDTVVVEIDGLDRIENRVVADS